MPRSPKLMRAVGQAHSENLRSCKTSIYPARHCSVGVAKLGSYTEMPPMVLNVMGRAILVSEAYDYLEKKRRDSFNLEMAVQDDKVAEAETWLG